MKSIFLSYYIDEDTPVYGGKTGTIAIRRTQSISEGATANNSAWEFPNHIGTHIDFPLHFSNSGKNCSDYPSSFWTFEKVGFLECGIAQIELEIEKLPEDIELLILKSGFGGKRGTEEYWKSQPVIPASLATNLRKRFPNLRMFGFDLISLTSKLDRAEGKKAHLAFLIEQDILVLEDMRLGQLTKTPQRVIVAPWQIKKADGVPSTVIAYL